MFVFDSSYKYDEFYLVSRGLSGYKKKKANGFFHWLLILKKVLRD